MKGNQKGIVVLDVVMALSIVALLTSALMYSVPERLSDARIQASIDQAKTILQVCEVARTRVQATSTDSSGKYIHTYATIPTWSSTDILQSKLTHNFNLPTKNALGGTILVKFDAARCYVAVDLPFREDGYGGLQTETVDGKTRVLVTVRAKTSIYPSWVVSQKRSLDGQETR